MSDLGSSLTRGFKGFWPARAIGLDRAVIMLPLTFLVTEWGKPHSKKGLGNPGQRSAQIEP